VREVAALYRTAVTGVLGEKGVTSVPPLLPDPVGTPAPTTWSGLVGDRGTAARVRAGGPGFLHPMIDDTAAVVPVPLQVTQGSDRMVVAVELDRARIEALKGPRRFGAVIEIRLNARPDQVHLAPENSPAAIAGKWLLGSAPATVISPEGVRVSGPGFALRARGPLIIGWSLARDRQNPAVTWLQALAFIDALEGDTREGTLRRPFTELYPGEPTRVTYEVELVRVRGS
jgi:hypothetical protein